jgi:hypothetical protein
MNFVDYVMKNLKIMNLYRARLFFFILLTWFLLSIFNVFYNIFKSLTEIRNWLPLSDYEKRQVIFGDLYPFLFFVGANTAKNSDILVYSNDIKTFYLSIYYLYPRIVTVVDNENDFNKRLNSGKFKYVAIYKNSYIPNSYRLSALMPGIGELYTK